MSRTVSALNAAAAAQPHVCMCIAVDLDFPPSLDEGSVWAEGLWAEGLWADGLWAGDSNHVRLHDGPGPLVIDGATYEGTGSVELLDKIEESIDVIARPVRLRLSGVDPEMIRLARTGGYQGRQVTIYKAYFDQDSGDLIDTPETIWEGMMDTIRITLAQNEASLTLNCEHRLRSEPRIARNTDQDQQLAYPGDRFFDRVGKVAGFHGNWGAKDVKAPTNPGPSPKYPNFRAT